MQLLSEKCTEKGRVSFCLVTNMWEVRADALRDEVTVEIDPLALLLTEANSANPQSLSNKQRRLTFLSMNTKVIDLFSDIIKPGIVH